MTTRHNAWMVAAILLAVSTAQPATINVTAGQSIQVAIDAANAGDEVVLAPGIYFETIDFLGKAITVRGSAGFSVTFIDPQGLPGPAVTCANGEGPSTVLDGVTIRNASDSGMFNSGSSPTVQNCRFMGNDAAEGGAMRNEAGSSPTLQDCTFLDNHASSRGGAIYNSGSSPSISNCTFVSNGVEGLADARGGGLYNISSSPVLNECTFDDNSVSTSGTTSATSYGGAMCTAGNSQPVLTACTFISNSAEAYLSAIGNVSSYAYGGALYNASSFVTLTDCQFNGNTVLALTPTSGVSSNQANSFGGAIANASSSPSLTDCVFVGNRALISETGPGIKRGYGGGMYNAGSSNPTLTSCTFDGNAAATDGGAMENRASSAPFLNGCTFENNTAERGGALTSKSATPLILGCSFTENSATVSGGAIYTTGGGVDLPNVFGASFCGNAPDHIAGNYFDEGGNEFACSCVLLCPGDIDGSCGVDITDFLNLLAQWGSDPGVPPDLDGDGTVGILDFLLLLANWGACP